MGTRRSIFRCRTGRIGLVAAVAALGATVVATPAFAADPLSLSPTHGPSGGGYSVTMTATSGTTLSTATGTLTIQFDTAATCTTEGTPTALAFATGTFTGVAQTTAAAPGAATLTITAPSTLALPANATTSAHLSVCVYNSSATLVAAVNAGFTLDADLTLNPTSGASGGGYPVTLSSSSVPFTPYTPSAHVVQFQAQVGSPASTCAAAPLGASTPTASDATHMTGGVIAVPSTDIQVPSNNSMVVTVPSELAQVVTPQKVFSANYNVCVYTSGGALLAETSTAGAFNLSGNTALSTTSGSSAGGNPVSITAATPIFASTNVVQLQSHSGASTCNANYTLPATNTVIDVPTVRFVTQSKLAVTMPTTGLPISTTAFAVCVYDSNSTSTSNLVGQAYGTYTVGQVPTVTSVSPLTGPAQGGSTITVNGSNFPTTPGAMTATLGGVPMTNLSVDSSGNFFTATVPPHAAGVVSVAVTTAGGTYTAQNLFTYSNGITVTPKTAPNTVMAPVSMDITGVGFSDLTFDTTYSTSTTNSTKAHVYLVKGTYDPTGTTTKANGQISGGDCVDVLIISDTELICNMYPGGNLAAMPTATTRSVSSCASYTSGGVVQTTGTPAPYLGPSSGTVTTCSFTQADVGMKITAGASTAPVIADNTTTIISVSSSGIATLSKAPSALVTAATTPISLSSQRTLASDAVWSTNTVSSVTEPFNTSDVGKMISGTNIPAGTYISAVNGSNVATLSNTPTATPTGTITIYNAAPIAIGTYTVTVVSNGAPGAQTSSTYKKSIISSGSTFTVADY